MTEFAYLFYYNQERVSINAPLFSGLNIFFPWEVSLNTASITDNSVAVVSVPQNTDQSLATIPAPILSLPLFTVPAHKGTYKRVESSSNSATPHIGWTSPPLLVILE